MAKIEPKSGNSLPIERYSRYLRVLLKEVIRDDDNKKHMLELRRDVPIESITGAIASTVEMAAQYGLFTSVDRSSSRVQVTGGDVFIVSENSKGIMNVIAPYIENRVVTLGKDKLKELFDMTEDMKIATIIELEGTQLTANCFNGSYGDGFFALLKESLANNGLLENNVW